MQVFKWGPSLISHQTHSDWFGAAKIKNTVVCKHSTHKCAEHLDNLMLRAISYLKVCQKSLHKNRNLWFLHPRSTTSGNINCTGWCIAFVLQQGLIRMKDQVVERRFCKGSTVLVRKAATVCQSFGGSRGHRGTNRLLSQEKMLKQRCRKMDDTQSKVSLDKKSSLRKGRKMKSFCSNLSLHYTFH